MVDIQFFAHSEELHNGATSELEHLLTSPAVAVPIYVIVNYIAFIALRKYKKSALVPAMLGLNFFIGVISFEAIPAISIIAISAGITAALLLSLSLLSGR